MLLNRKTSDVLAEANVKLAEIKTLADNPAATAEDRDKVKALMLEAKALKEDAVRLSEIEKLAAEMSSADIKLETKGAPADPRQFKTMGERLRSIWSATFKGQYDPRLSVLSDKDEPETKHDGKDGWAESRKDRKDLVENVGASGGFLVPVEYRPDLLQFPAPEIVIRPRATKIPMRHRQIQWPVMEQTGTTAGQPHWWGGAQAYWTEETAAKTEDEPSFRQKTLTAWKLCGYTEASDELLEDSAIALETLLNTIFLNVHNWYEEEAFYNGTGVGQPLGIVGAGATITVARAAQNAIGLVDILNMLENHQGPSPVWMITRSAISDLMQLNGPAANPSYVFMPSAREGMPGTLFGYPIFWFEHCPRIGTAGDIALCSWPMYLIGDRKDTTVDASKHYRFQYDITAWRAVKRVDGRPWLSAPLTWADGTTQSSPFCILGDKTT